MFMYFDTMIGCYDNTAEFTQEHRSFLSRLLGM